MIVNSKFRQMYLARITIIFVVGIVFAVKFLQISIMENGKFNFKYAPFWIGTFIGVALIIQIISILNLKKIQVYSDKIIIKYLFFNRNKVLFYNTILNIERLKVQQMVKSGPVNDGYYLSALNLANGKQEIISPDHFENYNEIINAIRSNIKQQ